MHIDLVRHGECCQRRWRACTGVTRCTSYFGLIDFVMCDILFGQMDVF
jgi:hypothetical protein